MCGFSSWYIAWLPFSLRLLAKFEFPARGSNKICLNKAVMRLLHIINLSEVNAYPRRGTSNKK